MNPEPTPAQPSATRLKRRHVMQLCKVGHKKQRKVNASRQQKVNGIKLSRDEISDISSQQMLTDKHISAANDLLKRQFPDARGLQPTFLGQNLTFQVVEPPFVQILHAGKNHWMTVIGIDQSLVKVYDSLYRCVAPSVTMQAASIMKSASDHIVFRIESMQIQEGSVDCGLFAIAYATEFCFGNNPECFRLLTELLSHNNSEI